MKPEGGSLCYAVRYQLINPNRRTDGHNLSHELWPQYHLCYSEKQPWLTLADTLPHYEDNGPDEA